MRRITSRSSFPFKKELAIGTGIWLSYAIPSGVLFFHPKEQVANVCWAVVAAATVFLLLPIVTRIVLWWPQAMPRASHTLIDAPPSGLDGLEA